MNKYLVRVWIDDIVVEAESPEQAEMMAIMRVDRGFPVSANLAEVQAVLSSELHGEVEHGTEKTVSGLYTE